MNITCVMVSSANGKITHGSEATIYNWTSPEDKEHFESMIADYSLIVMGRETYEAAKKVIRPQPGKLRIVLTRTPEAYSEVAIPGQLEFRNNHPTELVAELENQGYTRMLLAGGGSVNGQFFAENLVNDLFLTLEPELFGVGKEIISSEVDHLSLQLHEVTRLNKRGTLLLHYHVLPKKEDHSCMECD